MTNHQALLQKINLPNSQPHGLLLCYPKQSNLLPKKTNLSNETNQSYYLITFITKNLSMMYPKSNSYLPSKCLRLTPLLSFDAAKVRRFSHIRNIFLLVFYKYTYYIDTNQGLCANTPRFPRYFRIKWS